MTPEPPANPPTSPPPLPPATASPSPVADERRKRRNRLILLAVVYGLLLLETVGSDRPLSTSPGAGALGGALGAFGGMQLLQLVGLLLGRLGGTAPSMLVIGSGPLLGVRRIGPVSVQIRPIPLLPLQVVQSVVAVPALRIRLLLGGLCRVGVVGAVGAVLLVDGTHLVRMAGLGFLLIAVAAMLGGWKQPGSVGWMIFRAPTLDPTVLAALGLSPAEMAVQRALTGASYAEARAALPSLTTDRLAGVQLRAAVDIAEGRYREALDALRLPPVETDYEQSNSELLVARAALFGLEAGTIPRDEAMAVAGAASAGASARAPRLFAVSEILATQALLSGRAADALLLSRTGLRRNTDLQTQAFTLCTMAAAQAVIGDQPAARASLARARALAPDLARVQTVERLITELPLTRDRM